MAIVAGIAYMVILISLLYIQMHYISGELEKKYAVILACFISIPSFALLFGYYRLQIKLDIYKKQDTTENENRKITYDTFCALNFVSILSKRETEVAWLVYLGYSNQRISDELFISITTVKKHISHIYEKSGITCRKDFQTKMGDINYGTVSGY